MSDILKNFVSDFAESLGELPPEQSPSFVMASQYADMLRQLATVTRERDEARAERDEARKGKPIGPIVVAATIVEQELELKKLRELLIQAKDYIYNAFEPKNQSQLWYTIAAVLGDTTGGTGDGA